MFGKLYIVLAILITLANVGCLTVTNDENPDANSTPEDGRNSPAGVPLRKRCPLCDSSVFSYCTDKLFHDSCCCNSPHNPYYPLPTQCQYADCNFLHANSCQEHSLITACCCISHLHFLYKTK